MHNKISLVTTFMFVLIISGCQQQEKKVVSKPVVNIHLPTKSANVVFHIKDNKMSSYEIVNEDGTSLSGELLYQRVSMNADGTQERECYTCPAGATDLSKCTKIPCPPNDPCKEIACGPLSFEVFDTDLQQNSTNEAVFTIVADEYKK